MGFDIPNLHLDESSPEGRVVQGIIDREGVTPEEAVRRALSQAAPRERRPDDIFGLFSSPEDRALWEEVMETVHESREREIQVMRDHLERESRP